MGKGILVFGPISQRLVPRLSDRIRSQLGTAYQLLIAGVKDSLTSDIQSTATGIPSSGNSACRASAIPEGIDDEKVELRVSSPDANVKNQRYFTPQF